MEPRHARYPFFEAAREAVQAADVALADLVAAEDPAVERGVDRVERALLEGTVRPEEPRRWGVREELLSYPLARILVSLVDEPAAVRKYTEAEAATAAERLRGDFDAGGDGLRSAGAEPVSLTDELREFDLAAGVRPEEPADRRAGMGDGARVGGSFDAGAARAAGRADDPDPAWYRVGLGPYLELADGGWGERWRLVNREVAAGEVRVEREELYRLLSEAVRRRVAEGLPFDVRASPGGDAIADALEPAVGDLRELLADRTAAGSADVVAPDLFPPCVTALVARARDGESLPDPSAFTLVGFLLAAGLSEEELLAFLDAGDGDGDSGPDPEPLRARIAYLRDREGTQYPPPSCVTLQAYGDCVNMDERCETIAHPLDYYASAVEDAGEVTDWRDRADG